MDASELFRTGQLRAAIDIQTIKVKGRPTDQAARLFLFELLLFAGDLDRARKQLEILNYENPQAMAAVAAYRLALESETLRRLVLSGKSRPNLLADVPAHVELRLQALEKYGSGATAEGHALLDQANAEMPVIHGVLNGQPVNGLRDGDDLFGTVVEIFAGGRYSWVPLEQIENLSMNPPAHPRDVLLRPAQLTVRDGPNGDVLIPGLYPGTDGHSDDAFRVGRVTDWIGGDTDPVRGIGGKLFLAADNWVRFVDWQTFGSAAG